MWFLVVLSGFLFQFFSAVDASDIRNPATVADGEFPLIQGLVVKDRYGVNRRISVLIEEKHVNQFQNYGRKDELSDEQGRCLPDTLLVTCRLRNWPPWRICGWRYCARPKDRR